MLEREIKTFFPYVVFSKEIDHTKKKEKEKSDRRRVSPLFRFLSLSCIVTLNRISLSSEKMYSTYSPEFCERFLKENVSIFPMKIQRNCILQISPKFPSAAAKTSKYPMHSSEIQSFPAYAELRSFKKL